MLSPELRAAARALQIDLATAEVVSGFAGAGVASILLKGPAIARRLYPAGALRPYVDADLLVRDADRPAAEAVLRSRGFERQLNRREDEPDPAVLHADTWRRERDAASVDLHRSLAGVPAGPEAVWGALADSTDSLEVAGVRIDVPSDSGQALIVALHAAQHGTGRTMSVTDLARALEVLPLETWRAAATLAWRLRAAEPMAAGLTLVDGGAELARELGLPDSWSTEVELAAMTAAPGALVLEELTDIEGARRKARFLLRKAFPTAPYMRAASATARRGSLGLAGAYCWRFVRLIAQTPQALRDRRVARQRIRQGRTT